MTPPDPRPEEEEDDFGPGEDPPEADESSAPPPLVDPEADDPPLDLGPIEGALDLDLEEGFEGEEDDESEEEEAEAEDDEEALRAERRRKKSSKARGDLEAEPEPGDPKTKVPTKKKMLAALEWAFSGEEGVGSELLERFADHAIELLKQNRVMNLTAIQDPKEIAVKHYLDCWRVTRLVPLIAKKVVDFGCGGGFPGLPIAMAEPNCSMTLVDSTRKKIEWLEKTIAKLGVRNARAIHTRAEDHLTKERVDIVIVRAVSSVRENIRVLRKVRHSLQDMVMLKSHSWSREVRAAEREAERLGFKLDTVWEHELPEDMGKRAVLVYRAPGGIGF